MEARLRRRAKRQGLYVTKSRLRTPEVQYYGAYFVIDPESNGQLAACDSLDQLEDKLADLARRGYDGRRG